MTEELNAAEKETLVIQKAETPFCPSDNVHYGLINGYTAEAGHKLQHFF